MNYYASGKLMLFGEYLVLKGVPCLAMPVKYGQRMEIKTIPGNTIRWLSRVQGKEWFSLQCKNDLSEVSTSQSSTATFLLQILQLIHSEKPGKFESGLQFTVDADFPMEWGFGSSSTLISLLSQWSETDPYFLLHKTIGGSGFDVACAIAHCPILYQMEEHTTKPIAIPDSISSKLLFIYSGKKQNSKNEVNRFHKLDIKEEQEVKMKDIVNGVIKSQQIEEWEDLITQSEDLISGILGVPSIKQNSFSDYSFAIKSLGAWGGDFFMATFRNENTARNYFSNLGHHIQFNYAQLINH